MKSVRLEGLLGYQLRRAQLRAFGAFAEVTAETSLSPMLFGVLVTVADRPGEGQREIAAPVMRQSAGDDGLGQREVAAALGADPSTMVRLVDQLEARGLLRRVTHPVDRRTTVPTLTDSGRELLARPEVKSAYLEGGRESA